MPSRFESYRMVDGKTPLAAAYFNPILQELDLRLVGLEELRASWLEAVAQVQELGLARINELVGQPMQTVNDAISEMEHRIAALPHMVSQEQLSHQLQQAMQAEEQARAQLQQALDTLHQTVHQMGGVDVFPSMEGKAGQFLTNDGDGRAWGIPKVTDLQRGTAQPRQLLGVSPTGVLVGMPPWSCLTTPTARSYVPSRRESPSCVAWACLHGKRAAPNPMTTKPALPLQAVPGCSPPQRPMSCTR